MYIIDSNNKIMIIIIIKQKKKKRVLQSWCQNDLESFSCHHTETIYFIYNASLFYCPAVEKGFLSMYINVGQSVKIKGKI